MADNLPHFRNGRGIEILDVTDNVPLPELHALNGKRLVTPEEYKENCRIAGRKYQAEQRKIPEVYAAMKEKLKQKYHANLEDSRQKVKQAYYRKDRRKLAAYARMRYAKDPDRHKSNDLKCKYGITLQEWTTLFEFQGKCCAICKCGESKTWSTDHNHSTNKIRGILCNNCNTALGLFRENATALFNAIEYLKR
jgi:hypothetical protein